MDRLASFTQRERAELFEQTASRRGFHPAIAEKDFWVCWVLKKLFESEDLSPHLVFKGGTSLSKVYGLIDRFSEDIDLVLNWELLGYGAEGEDPWQALDSNTKVDRFNKAFNRKAGHYIKTDLCHRLVKLLECCPDVRVAVSEDDAQVVKIRYPAAFELGALRPEVKLEIGPLASWVPSGTFPITPYAAEEFPDIFQEPSCKVRALTASRTFWEKATILHQQVHRVSNLPAGYSRHYYDLHKLAGSEQKVSAFDNSALLLDVLKFKQRFYHSKLGEL